MEAECVFEVVLAGALARLALCSGEVIREFVIGCDGGALRMGEGRAIRVLLLALPPAAHEARGAVAEALRELGAIEVCHDVAAARAALAGGGLALIVLDARVVGALEWLAGLRGSGAPAALAITRSDTESVAAFRAGAGECVSAGDGVGVLLPAARGLMARRASAEPAPDALEGAARSVVQHMNSALLVLDRAGAVTVANPTAAQLLGMRPESIVGRPFSHWFSASRRCQPLVQPTLERGEKLRGAEALVARGDGR